MSQRQNPWLFDTNYSVVNVDWYEIWTLYWHRCQSRAMEVQSWFRDKAKSLPGNNAYPNHCFYPACGKSLEYCYRHRCLPPFDYFCRSLRIQSTAATWKFIASSIKTQYNLSDRINHCHKEWARSQSYLLSLSNWQIVLIWCAPATIRFALMACLHFDEIISKTARAHHIETKKKVENRVRNYRSLTPTMDTLQIWNCSGSAAGSMRRFHAIYRIFAWSYITITRCGIIRLLCRFLFFLMRRKGFLWFSFAG